MIASPDSGTTRDIRPMTAAALKQLPYRDLVQMARSQGVAGWHSMRKDDLVQALVKLSKQRNRMGAGTGKANGAELAPKANGSAREQRAAMVRDQLSQMQAKVESGKILCSHHPKTARVVEQDRLVVMVRDPYWLQAYWELTRQSIDRAQSAMGQSWHKSQPILRLFKVGADGSSSIARQIPVHGGVSHWYIDVNEPPSQFRLEIGYHNDNGQFYCLARSNSVSTPPASTSDSVDENWSDVAQHADRIFAMSGGYQPRGTSLELQELLEERLGRPMGTPMETRYGSGAARALADKSRMPFSVDAELLVFGVSQPNAHVTLLGEPVPLRPDGSFSVRMSLAERRQVIPVIASSSDGVEQRTIILAVERNTKVLEPRVRELTQ
jgi:hypothetical protein